MILLIALAAAAAPVTVADAERAFAAKSARDGQWTAFRATAAPEGVMFAPEIINAQTFLKDRADPPSQLRWAPALTIRSCDGNVALSTGPWTAGAAHGTFTTMWKRKPGTGWRWLYDSGRDIPRALPLPAKANELSASCANRAAIGLDLGDRPGPTDLATLIAAQPADSVIIQEDGRMPAHAPSAARRVMVGKPLISGASGDRTLIWQAAPLASQKAGAHLLRVWTWAGSRYALRLMDVVGLKTP